MAEENKEIERMRKQVSEPIKRDIGKPMKKKPEETAEEPYGYPVDVNPAAREQQEKMQKEWTKSPTEKSIKDQMRKQGTYFGGETPEEGEEEGQGKGEGGKQGGSAGDFAKRTFDNIKKALSKTIGGSKITYLVVLINIGNALGIIVLLIIFGTIIVALTPGCSGKTITQEADIVRDNNLINCLLANTGDKEAFSRCVSGSSQDILTKLKSSRNTAPAGAQPIIDKLIDKFQQLINAQAKGDNTKDIIDEIYVLTLELKKYYPDIGPASADLNNVNKPIGKIVVNRGELRAYFYDTSGNKMGSAPINIGTNNHPTLTGSWTVTWKKDAGNSYVTSSNYKTTEGQPVPMGHIYIEFKQPYGIHGDIDENQNSLNSTYGCIRMYNADLARIFPYVNVDSTNVEITN